MTIRATIFIPSVQKYAYGAFGAINVKKRSGSYSGHTEKQTEGQMKIKGDIIMWISICFPFMKIELAALIYIEAVQ